MSRWRIEPMDNWRFADTEKRRGNPFRSTFDQTLKLLTQEAEHLGLDGEITLLVVAGAVDVRQDGMLRARATVFHPGVAVQFTSKFGSLTYPCDTFHATSYGEVDWQINLRAIALGLEALRKLDRYGVGSRGEQYRSWLAIEAPRNADDELSTPDGALRFLRRMAPSDSGEATTGQAWRAACRTTHPDNNGGERGLWDAVQRAGRTLGLTV
jgi:hypothetical protein